MEDTTTNNRKTGFWVCAAAILIVGTAIAQSTPPEDKKNQKKSDEPIVYKISDGRIEIKPRLKYELIISLDVFYAAEDHHKLFIPWVEQMRKDLSAETLRDAITLRQNSNEWQLCTLVQDYDGPDTIEGLTEFIRVNNNKVITKWARRYGREAAKALGLSAEQFADWYAGFLMRYYKEGFEKQWLSEHKKLVFDDAEFVAEELKSLDFSPTKFMEDFTGRKFVGSTKIILYPSSFSRPSHAYGF